jgi:glutamyl-tRNA synthetase/glutamyl-Q tRNA(Asp) synthetase
MINLEQIDLINTPKTRFAPSPTGYLHIGHLLHAIFLWGIARAKNCRIILRLEDHDQSRCRPEYAEAIKEDLEWLGLEWDELQVQSEHFDRYQEALNKLTDNQQTYTCDCSRKSIKETMLKKGLTSSELWYSGFCRSRSLTYDKGTGVRLIMPPTDATFNDLAMGPACQTPATQCGDLLLRDRKGFFTYQFAVTVDDFYEDIDLIIRGQDIFPSTGRQLLLRKLLGTKKDPLFLHHPLVTDDVGVKLSKRFISESIRQRRQLKDQPDELLGKAAFLGGLILKPRPLQASELPLLFR